MTRALRKRDLARPAKPEERFLIYTTMDHITFPEGKVVLLFTVLVL